MWTDHPSTVDAVIEDAAKRMHSSDVRALSRWAQDNLLPGEEPLAEPFPMDTYRRYARAALSAIPVLRSSESSDA